MHFEKLIQVSIITVLHDYVERIILNERLPVSNNEGVHKFTHYGGFIDGLNTKFGTLFLAFSLSLPKLICFNTHIYLVVLLRTL